MSETHTLVVSSNSGRYAIDEPTGQDITSGVALDVYLAGQWVEGTVEHAMEIYANRGLRFLGDKAPDEKAIEGYYLVTEGGGICGLCVGMTVRIP